MNGALNDLHFGISDDMTLIELRECYASFLSSLTHEIEVLVRGGSFSSESELEEWLSDYCDMLEHVFTPSKARVFMTVTLNPEACLREVGAYGAATDATFWCQMAFHAQLADLKDAIGLARIYDWLRREHHAEASRYDEFVQF
jgi:hypothetical protein